MKSEDLKKRFIQYTLDVLKLVKKLPKNTENEIFFRQIVRAVSSIGANYSEAIFAHSRIEFIHILNIARKEASETLYWLELIKATNPAFANEVNNLISEGTQILKILISSIKTSKNNNGN